MDIPEASFELLLRLGIIQKTPAVISMISRGFSGVSMGSSAMADVEDLVSSAWSTVRLWISLKPASSCSRDLAFIQNTPPTISMISRGFCGASVRSFTIVDGENPVYSASFTACRCSKSQFQLALEVWHLPRRCHPGSHLCGSTGI